MKKSLKGYTPIKKENFVFHKKQMLEKQLSEISLIIFFTRNQF